MKKKNHILIITGRGRSLINFRLSLIKKILARGHKVSVVAPLEDFSIIEQKKLLDLGIDLNIFELSRTKLNIFNDLKFIFRIYRIIKYLKPNIILSYTIKAVIYSGIISKIFKKTTFYPLITGLGYIFIDRNLLKHKILKYIVIKLYRYSLKSSEKVIFQNKDDKALFLKEKIINRNIASYIVNGSGVDLKAYPFSFLPTKPIFLMISRLLVDKGVKEYIEAAKIVKKLYPDVLFKLAGRKEQNPASLNEDEFNELITKDYIEYLGEVRPIKPLLVSCKFFVLPSYREGVPRSTLEALSIGRPIITTDVPGCRETVINKKNGILVPVKDSKALASAMIKLLQEKDEVIKNMAYESFIIAKNKFDVNIVNSDMINIMNL